MLGTHNSGITLADGYGNLDPQFGDYFQWIKWVVSAWPALLSSLRLDLVGPTAQAVPLMTTSACNCVRPAKLPARPVCCLNACSSCIGQPAWCSPVGLVCSVNPPGWLVQATDPGTLRTNDQWFSLTDQMQLGVRVIELDTHWFAVSAAKPLELDCQLEPLHSGPLHS